MCVGYFADCPIEQMTDGEYTCIDVWRKGIYLSNTDDETGKITTDYITVKEVTEGEGEAEKVVGYEIVSDIYNFKG